jgi:hypothetical protein
MDAPSDLVSFQPALLFEQGRENASLLCVNIFYGRRGSDSASGRMLICHWLSGCGVTQKSQG